MVKIFFSPLSFVAGIRDPGSEIRDPRSGIRDEKKSGSGIKIPDLQHCTLLKYLPPTGGRKQL
jgi:hypothetical protein